MYALLFAILPVFFLQQELQCQYKEDCVLTLDTLPFVPAFRNSMVASINREDPLYKPKILHPCYKDRNKGFLILDPPPSRRVPSQHKFRNPSNDVQFSLVLHLVVPVALRSWYDPEYALMSIWLRQPTWRIGGFGKCTSHLSRLHKNPSCPQYGPPADPLLWVV